MARVPALTALLHRARRHPLAQRLRRTVLRRLLIGWATVRRAWRRSLQLRMVTITLLMSAVLVGAFGVLVASQVTDGLVRNAVAKARVKVDNGRDDVVQPQLAGLSDRNDRDLNNTVAQVLNQLASNPEQGPDVIVALLPVSKDSALQFKSQSVPVLNIDSVVPDALKRRVAQGYIAHEFVTADLGTDAGPSPYLIYGTPVPSPVGTFALYYVFPLDAESDAATLVRNTVIITGAALVLLLALLAALVTRLVVRPVRTAARTAQRFSLGLFDQRMEVRGEDDLAMLAASFNQMAENLQRQIARLEEMSRLQRRFTSDVSHELRTPLTTVRMAADLIFAAREDFEPAVARSAELFQAELDRFEELLTDLLEISRFDAGFAVLDAEPTDLVPLLTRVVERLRSVAEAAGVPLRLEVPDAPVIAEIDPRRAERILRNLIGNAVDHGEGREAVVRLGISETAVAVTVRDHGIGLQLGEEKLVFNRFWRADPSRARKTGGTGLGLSISLEDARLHGGWLEAWGSPGQGAQFRLTLPVRAGDRLTSSPLRLVPDGAVVRTALLALSVVPAEPGDGYQPARHPDGDGNG
ncbi:MAG TPA: MtrAB system histidine kinase MtrB [Rugosimonospora sp.]|nr:MtrAB system histidine kinase MtrB [Rugosimonospora sp.]